MARCGSNTGSTGAKPVVCRVCVKGVLGTLATDTNPLPAGTYDEVSLLAWINATLAPANPITDLHYVELDVRGLGDGTTPLPVTWSENAGASSRSLFPGGSDELQGKCDPCPMPIAGLEFVINPNDDVVINYTGLEA